MRSNPPPPPSGDALPGPERHGAHDPERTRRLISLSRGGTAAADPAREELVRSHRRLVEHCARRFADRGEPLEDLVQVGMIGLLKALDRYDPGRRTAFTSYAVPTILGELRRHLRDHGPLPHLPRGAQLLRQRVLEARAELGGPGRTPGVAEIAEHLGISAAEVADGLAAAGAHRRVPLDPESHPLADRLGREDPGLGLVELRFGLTTVLARLPERERRIVVLHFTAGLSQAQIAEEIGVSQMQVSRLLRRSLERLRTLWEDDPGEHPPTPTSHRGRL